MKFLLIRFLLVTVIVLAAPVRAQPAAGDTAAPSGSTTAEQGKWQHLELLVDMIDAKRSELSEQRRALVASQSETEQAQLEKEIAQLVTDLESLQTAWEMLATGEANLGLFGVKIDTAFNWRDELQSVFEPLLIELKRLTERPRRIEQLRSDQKHYQQRLDVAEEALQSISRYHQDAPTPGLKKAFGVLENRWRKRRDELDNHLRLVNLELQDLFAADSQPQRSSLQALKELLSGRVLNLLLAMMVMLLVYLSLRGAAYVYNRYVVRAARRRSMMMRFGNLLFYLFTSLLVLLAGMSVLYMRGDWVLLGLLIILLLGAGWALQRSLPRYMDEAKLMLNMGPVREGERLIYRDLPWRVKNLGLYCTLVNPELEGGLLQLPLRKLVDYNSREFSHNEVWFPTHSGDFVVLDNGNYGQIIAQTPEYVHMLVLGAIKTWRTTAFVDQNPRNLSQQGFTLVISFGLDYELQPGITTTVPETLEQELIAALKQSDSGPLLTTLSVEFSQAGVSSLDLVVVANFTGEAADRYYKIQRQLQRLAVDTCNKHGWVIPFAQITVHQASGE